jgi:SAM-dependent methyltransferase
MPSPPPPAAPTSTWSRARSYARWFDSPLGRAYKRSIEERIRPWIDAARPRIVLDAGCGPILTFADALVPEAAICAVDCSFEMARHAHERLLGLGRRGAVACASAERLPFRDASFDFVLSMNCLEFVGDQGRALRELRRVATPRATVVIGVLNRRGLWEPSRRVGARFSTRPYYQGRFFAEDELARALEAAGWRDVELADAARFPPLPLPHERWYRGIERMVPASACGVLLARATRG